MLSRCGGGESDTVAAASVSVCEKRKQKYGRRKPNVVVGSSAFLFGSTGSRCPRLCFNPFMESISRHDEEQSVSNCSTKVMLGFKGYINAQGCSLKARLLTKDFFLIAKKPGGRAGGSP